MNKKIRFLSAFLALFLSCGIAMAQNFTAKGIVTDSKGEALIGVNVSIKATGKGTITGIDGDFELSVPESNPVLLLTYVGFKTQEIKVSPSKPEVKITMEEDVTSLDEVVVTGLATSVKRSNSANAVSSISAKQLTGVAPAQTMDGALYGKFTGANIQANSGAPGGGMSVKLRGVTSINGQSQPLYIIDGIYVDNSSIPAGLNVVSKASAGGSASNQDNPSNRIADINMDDIESMEILKGASAAAIYGSRAAAGVVIIKTKRGKAGETKVSLSQSAGYSEIINPLGSRDWNAEKVADAFGEDEVAVYQQAVTDGKLFDYEDEVLGNRGFLSNTRLSVSGGNEKTTFFAGVSYKDESGIVKNTGYQKTAARLNVDHYFNDYIDFSISNYYVNSSADRGYFNNDNTGTSILMSMTSLPPWADLHADENGVYPNNPYGASNPLQTIALMTNNEKVNRYIGGGTMNARILENEKTSLKFVLRGGVDQYTLNTTAIFPKDLQFQSGGNGTNGASIQGNSNIFNYNIAAFLVSELRPNAGLTFRTQAGVTRENFSRNTIMGVAQNLIGSETNLDQAGSQQVNQFRQLQTDMGFFVQEEINWEDKVIAAFGVRGDKSSNNGDANKLYYYPKASLAVNTHKFFAENEVLSQLKFRTAYGESGNFAAFGSTFTSFNPAIINGVAGATIQAVKGNPDIQPERQTEFEAGIDFGFFRNKLTLQTTFYNKVVKDLLLSANTAPSSGYSSKMLNGADMRNRGVEIGLNYNVVNNSDLTWDFGTNFWLNRSLITRLDIPAYNTGAFGATLGTFRLEEGYSPTQMVGIGPADQAEDDSGLVVFGDAQPDFQMSFSNAVSYKNFDLSFLVHWKQGGDNINLTKLLTDIYKTSADYDDMTLDPEGQLSNGVYRSSQLGSSAAPFVEDASYVKLREVALYYTLPGSALRNVFGKGISNIKMGVSGNNLMNFFSYNSYDPEVSNFGSGGISSGVEVTPFPSSKRVMFHLNVNF